MLRTFFNIVAADVRRRRFGQMSSGNPPPHLGGYGVFKQALRKAISVLIGLLLLGSAQAAEQAVDVQKHSNGVPASLNLLQSRGAIAVGREESDYGLGDCYYKNL